MTREELKQQYSMRDVIARYGFYPDRKGFIHCPFHKGDKGASMKIYDKDFHCFGCGANGDIFSFVQMMENVDFKEAFYSLGGTYEKPTFSSKLAVYRAKKRIESKKKEERKKQEQRLLNAEKIDIYRNAMRHSEPLSNVWCDCYNALQKELYRHSEINDLERRW